MVCFVPRAGRGGFAAQDLIILSSTRSRGLKNVQELSKTLSAEVLTLFSIILHNACLEELI